MNKIRRIGTDLAGYSLIILGLLTGWLPGPGGIPLILAGLGLLSINNAWAKKLIDHFKEKGSKFMEYIFPDKPVVKALHDISVLVLIGVVAFVLGVKISPVTIGFAIALTALAAVDIVYNRKRWERLKNKLTKS